MRLIFIPSFQRFYRWSDEQKSRLVESILLNIPIPSIFVSQREDAVWDVVDGLQRLSTIFELIGELKDDKGETLPALILQGTKYLPSLEGKTWEPTAASEGIGAAHQLIVRRSKIDVKIILRESNSLAKYELFQRAKHWRISSVGPRDSKRHTHDGQPPGIRVDRAVGAI